MASRPGGPLPDYVSQTQYATELAKQQPAVQREEPQQRDDAPKLTPEQREAAERERIQAQNERTGERNSAERAEKLGDNQQQKPEQDQQAAKEAYNREIAAKLAESSFSRDLPLERQREQQHER